MVSQVRSLVEGLEFSISYTTRQPRGSEEDGREYYFTTYTWVYVPLILLGIVLCAIAWLRFRKPPWGRGPDVWRESPTSS